MTKRTWTCRSCGQPGGQFRSHKRLHEAQRQHARWYHPWDGTDRLLLRLAHPWLGPL